MKTVTLITGVTTEQIPWAGEGAPLSRRGLPVISLCVEGNPDLYLAYTPEVEELLRVPYTMLALSNESLTEAVRMAEKQRDRAVENLCIAREERDGARKQREHAQFLNSAIRLLILTFPWHVRLRYLFTGKLPV